MRRTQLQRQRESAALRILLAGGATSAETALHPRYHSGAPVSDDTLTQLEIQELIEGHPRVSPRNPPRPRYWLTPKGVEQAASLEAARETGVCPSAGASAPE